MLVLFVMQLCLPWERNTRHNKTHYKGLLRGVKSGCGIGLLQGTVREKGGLLLRAPPQCSMSIWAYAAMPHMHMWSYCVQIANYVIMQHMYYVGHKTLG